MTSMGKLRHLVCLVMCFGTSARAQQGCQADWVQSISAQILDLRAHIGELLAEAHQQKLTELSREMEEIRGRQQVLDKEEHQLRQQITDVEGQLATSGLEPQAREQVEAVRNQLTGDLTTKLRSDRAALEQRQADTAGRLTQELQSYQRVKDWARQLESTPARQ